MKNDIKEMLGLWLISIVVISYAFGCYNLEPVFRDLPFYIQFVAGFTAFFFLVCLLPLMFGFFTKIGVFK